jgi:hypothetical protein
VTEAWFSILGEPLGDDETREIAAYLAGLGMNAAMPIHQALTWKEAGELCRAPSDEWWRAEEDERTRLERSARLDPADPQWLALNEALHGAAAVAAYQARLARAAAVAGGHPFLRKYALYCGGRWPLGIYDRVFAIF